jgi:hypothetical protein
VWLRYGGLSWKVLILFLEMKRENKGALKVKKQDDEESLRGKGGVEMMDG